jgi:hypothetical protein
MIFIGYTHSQKIGNTNELKVLGTKEKDDRLVWVLTDLFINIYK